MASRSLLGTKVATGCPPRVTGAAGRDAVAVAQQVIEALHEHAWDAAGADAFGFRVFWINRFSQTPERLGTGFEAELASLAPLPDLVA